MIAAVKITATEKTENGDIDIFAKCVNTFSRNNHFKVKLRIQLILILFVSVVD